MAQLHGWSGRLHWQGRSLSQSHLQQSNIEACLPNRTIRSRRNPWWVQNVELPIVTTTTTTTGCVFTDRQPVCVQKGISGWSHAVPQSWTSRFFTLLLPVNRLPRANHNGSPIRTHSWCQGYFAKRFREGFEKKCDCTSTQGVFYRL